MVSKCANPGCSARLHYLHEGRIFRFDLEAVVPGASRDQTPTAESHAQLRATGSDGKARREYFWLCDRCSAGLTLGVQDGEVVVRPIALLRAPSRAAS